MVSKKSAVVVGAGIVGISLTRALHRAGFHVTVLEKSSRPQGASIRNFGMFWPIGQPSGEGLELAHRSRHIWRSLREKAGFWLQETGSLHLAYTDLEAAVMHEYIQCAASERSASYLSPDVVVNRIPSINRVGLRGALWSAEEMLMDPREAIQKLTRYFEEQKDVDFHWNTPVTDIHQNRVYAGKRFWQADVLFLCTGSDWNMLPTPNGKEFPLVNCKLQMMRTPPQPTSWQLPTPLAFGLSLVHYPTFQVAPSISALASELAHLYPNFVKWGVHVMAAQNAAGEVTIGDTHQYGDNLSPFDDMAINQEVFDYLLTRLNIASPKVLQTWHGIYAKPRDGSRYYFSELEPGVWILNGLGGAGMTLSLGLAEVVVGKL
ncbi:putative secreted oxidoreductase [Lunatimonas lonarensis]|uniref:Putative secreted oxidoreductase n=1 Tax=Lunatimonas lonarensis TaxID=1232681 RepID=R7ZRQ6_9BACT|nr:TIGR03364 family FAD-dependent oxidoreductase [Lunatimonas lonarensis]EON76836.1 putative secreted oxidoreductase [Lunatimonas lonarensis]